MVNKIPHPGLWTETISCVLNSQQFYNMSQVPFRSAVCRYYIPQPMMYLRIARNLLSGMVISGRHISEHISNLTFKKHKWRQYFWEYLIIDPKETDLNRKLENILPFQRWLTTHLYCTCYSSNPGNVLFSESQTIWEIHRLQEIELTSDQVEVGTWNPSRNQAGYESIKDAGTNLTGRWLRLLA